MMPKPNELAIMVDVFLAGYNALNPEKPAVELDDTLARVAAAETIMAELRKGHKPPVSGE